jgi:hypothetical protein
MVSWFQKDSRHRIGLDRTGKFESYKYSMPMQPSHRLTCACQGVESASKTQNLPRRDLLLFDLEKAGEAAQRLKLLALGE